MLDRTTKACGGQAKTTDCSFNSDYSRAKPYPKIPATQLDNLFFLTIVSSCSKALIAQYSIKFLDHPGGRLASNPFKNLIIRGQ